MHKDFLVPPIDKSTGNIAFVCKRFYATVIVKELGLITTHLQVLIIKSTTYLQMISQQAFVGLQDMS